jgi:HmuY protein
LTRPPILVLALAGAFLLLVAALLIGSFTKPDLPPYTVTAPAPAPVGDTLVGPATYTLDASDGERWRTFAFSRNSAVDSGSWDIAFRRHHVIAAAGAGIADLGVVPFDSVRELPADSSRYAATDFGRDTVNAGVGKWYAYSMLSHLLTSKRHVYAVRGADGRYAKFEILAYYCRGVGAACYTIRYARFAK